MEDSARLLQITICNFKSFLDVVHVIDIADKNNIVGERHLVKQDLVTAVYFGLGAVVTELGTDKLMNVQADPSEDTYVELTLGLKDSTVPITVVRRTLRENGENEQFDYQTRHRTEQNISRNLYLNNLRDLGFDLHKQIHFFGALDRNFCWSVLTSKQDELIAVLSTVASFPHQVRQYHDFKDAVQQADRMSDIRERNFIMHNDLITKLQELLPCEQHAWVDEFTAYTISRLKREETERSKKIEELNSVLRELREIDNVNLQLQTIIDEQYNNMITKRSRNLEVEVKIFSSNPLYREASELAFKIRISKIEKSIKANDIHIQSHRTHIAEFERYKTSCEANIALINNLNGTRKLSPVVTEDALLKLYPMFHGSDDFEMDKRELELLELQGELNKIEMKRETDQQFELLFPAVKTKETVRDYRETFTEIFRSFKGIFHPNAYLYSFDELKLELLHSKICSSKGFVLCKGLQPIDEEHKNLINNILSDFKQTIVLYKDDTKRISTMLKKVHPEWFQYVRFLVLTSVTDEKHLNYVSHPDHWLNYCKYNVNGGSDTARSKLMYHLGVKYRIICVERHETVQNEFFRGSKKYVASVDGQLIYTCNAMGIDVLMYFQPGKPVETMHFPEACQRLKNSFTKLSEWMSGWLEPEIIPRDLGPDVDTSDLQAEVDAMKKDFAKLNVDRINRMETLRQQLNEPKDVNDVQNYADRLQEEQESLQQINTSIAKARRDIEGLEMENTAMLQEMELKTVYIQLRAEVTQNQTEITLHEKIIEENKTEIKKTKQRKYKLQMESERLQIDIKNLKYKTIKTIMRAEQEGIDCTTIGCTTPNSIQAIRNGMFVDPYVVAANRKKYISSQISILRRLDIRTLFDDMTDTVDENKICGRGEWYNLLAAAKTERDTVRDKLHTSNLKKEEYIQKIMQMKPQLDVAFNSFNNTMTQILNNIAKDSNLRTGFEYAFLFRYDSLRVSEMIFAISNGHTIGFDGLNIEDQTILYWLLFAALNQYSKAPFAFIDLLDVNEKIIACVAAIVEQIATKTQLFIVSSHMHHLRFANLQIVINKKNQRGRILQHDITKYENIGHDVPPTTPTDSRAEDDLQNTGEDLTWEPTVTSTPQGNY